MIVQEPQGRPVILDGRFYTPIGATARGWECAIVEEQNGICYAVVCDGFTQHMGLRVNSPAAAADDLMSLLQCMEATIATAHHLAGDAGSN